MTSYLTIGIIIAGIAASMVFATYMYYQYQPNFVLAESGQPIQVGPVVYTVEYVGLTKGDEDIAPDNIFFKIKITAENTGTSTTLLSGGQFYLLDDKDTKHRPIFGDFDKEDLFNDNLDPNESVSRTTQFDIAFDENMQYRIGILPTKEQSSTDIGIVCLLNC